jgi:hypothetical protein
MALLLAIVAGGIWVIRGSLHFAFGQKSIIGQPAPVTVLAPPAPPYHSPSHTSTKQAVPIRPSPKQAVPVRPSPKSHPTTPPPVINSGPGAISLPASAWRPVDDATISAESSDGSFSVSAEGTYWPGIIASPGGIGCDYVFSGEGQLVEPGDNGYAFVVRASMADGEPSGHGIQYDPGIGGYRDVEYPDESETGTVIPVLALDGAWHTISVVASGQRYTESVDGQRVFSGTTSYACGGLYIRLWRARVRFANLTVTPLG